MLMLTASLNCSAPWMVRHAVSESTPQPLSSVPVGDTATSTASAETSEVEVGEGKGEENRDEAAAVVDGSRKRRRRRIGRRRIGGR